MNYKTLITDEDKYALLNSNTTILTKIIVKEQDTLPEIILTEEDSVKSWSYDDDRYVPDTGFIGQFVARTLSGELQNINDEFNIEDREIQVCFGIKDFSNESEEINWYTLGSFLIQRPEDDEVNDNTKFEAMDYTLKFNKDFNADYTSSDFPVSFNDAIKNNQFFNAKQLAQYICAQVGVEFANEHFINDDFLLTTNQFVSGDSCRDVMKNIAQLAFGWVRIGWDDKCYIDELETNIENIPNYNEINNDHYYSLKTQKKAYGPVDRIAIGMENINGEALFIPRDVTNYNTTLYVYDNPITFTNDLRNEVIDGGEYLLGMSYTPFESETPGHPWLLGKNLIKIVDMEGNVKLTYPFNLSINYTGHIKTKIEAPAFTKTEEMMAYPADLYKTLKNVSVTVNKQEGTIVFLNESVKATADGFEALKKSVEHTITDTYSRTQINDIVSGIGVDGVVVESVQSTAGTFDKDGLTIEQYGTNTKTNINSDGMIIYNATGSTDTPMLIVDHTGVIADNIRVSTYTTLGSHSRFEDYRHTDGTEGTGVFWVGR